ncbi:MAG: CoA transferase [Dehalococcoidia bacterium]|mgnify:CR=1 FL=1|nr:CoA transferase [Dehalococcoidia bacterium]MDP6510617.1 CoA transferase [Dehalococcoidia bacterium]MDP6782014.1 CoA transferase [Dehalococcoidia bacterium]
MMPQGILRGVRVLELGPLVALPLTGRYLAAMGAEVIKLETNRVLDDMNYIPGWRPGVGQPEYQALKRRITLDVRNTKAKPVLEKLFKISDVFITNFRRRVLREWGFDFPQIREMNPNIIVLWQTGAGSQGPYGEYKTFGNLIQHLCGISPMTGPDGEDTPGTANNSYSDYHAGVFQPMAIIAALLRRRRTGKTAFMECSIFKAGAVTVGPAVLDFQANGHFPPRMANRHRFAAPHNAYPCQGEDSWCAISVFTPQEWSGLVQAMGSPAWSQDGRFTTAADRVRNAEELDGLISQWTGGLTAGKVMQRLQQVGVPAGLVAKGQDLAESPQLQAREFYRDTHYYVPERDKPGSEWENGGQVKAWSVPIRFSETPCQFGPLHRVGEDNDYVYRELCKISPQEMDELNREGILS